MTATPRLVRDRALPARFAVVGGAVNACSVGGFALLAAGQGIAAWTLMTAGVLAMVGVRLSWRSRVDGSPLGTSLGAGVMMATLIALVVAGALVVRVVTLDAPWLAALVAVLVGAATGALLRWWQLRPVLSPV
ncbi:hypothetical protein [Cellulomonas wangsupingiae]|uniref:hypothetical protein n=1 Tax=Cellulomonas wangsupingiae TaxID=2968085 RepID=UPI001D0E6DEC|nr:hypothetical protein [Cellulomonas wangsupingiae]MCM0639097.1 hypothetical protein [Cellulomonas wangsupingiae]